MERLRAERDEARAWARALLTLADVGTWRDAWGLGEIAVGVVPEWLTVLGPGLEPDKRGRPPVEGDPNDLPEAVATDDPP